MQHSTGSIRILSQMAAKRPAADAQAATSFRAAVSQRLRRLM